MGLCFLFKQKTAYEMRISDWSSDVCSSDLMVMDSLRYWVEEVHVDGFRFDLATALGREREHFDENAVFFEAVGQDPVLSSIKLIAEPWDIEIGRAHV